MLIRYVERVSIRDMSSSRGVIGERGLVAEDGARTHVRISSEIAAPADDGSVDLRSGGDASVRPDHRISDLRLFVDMDAGTENRIHDPSMRFDDAAFADH